MINMITASLPTLILPSKTFNESCRAFSPDKIESINKDRWVVGNP